MTTSITPPVDLTNCDREPIHLSGAVQPFGMLIAVSGTDWNVTRASRSVEDWLGIPAEKLIGTPLTQLFTFEAIQSIRRHLQSSIMSDTVARVFDIAVTSGGLRCDLAVHIVEDSIVIECEPSIPETEGNSGLMVRGMLARLQQTGDLRAFYRVAARELRAMTGFDRVMVYRFDHDGSGEVIAESARSGLESYLGLHYPASDIPKQARILYERNWLRLIADIDAPPSPITPQLDNVGKPLDLSKSVLRSVSPIHIEYLRNMGVGASMSVSILRSDNKLWGLFACHHYAPHHVPFAHRTAAELFGQMFSLLLENREREGEATYEQRAQKLHHQLVTVMASEETQFESIVTHLDDIADLLACDGIGVWVNGHATLKGLTPGEEPFTELISYLIRKGVDDVYATFEIGAEFPAGSEFAERAAGMLVVPLSRPPRDFLIFFRKEVTRSVNWAGDPTKPVVVGPLGARLTPRKSFELWKETVSGQSLPWLPVECRIAESLRVSLLEVILRLSDLAENERRRAQQRQDLLIDELNHRVRNILSLIRGVITQSRDVSNTVESFTRTVGGRIQALARAHDLITADRWGPASLTSLLKAEAAGYLAGAADRVVLTGSDVLLEPQAFTTVALVIHEMITNSAKYGALSDNRGRVEVNIGFDSVGRLLIGWREFEGPPVSPPGRRGFGSTVIERSIRHDLKGEVTIDYALAGLRAEFIIPASYFRRATGSPMPTPESPSEPPKAAQKAPTDVLLVEDNLIIALDAEDMLQELGVGKVRTASSVHQALELITAQVPGFAMLDVNLGAETSFGIAERLLELGVPFAFATGYGDQHAFPPQFANAPIVRKPYSVQTLQDALSKALSP